MDEMMRNLAPPLGAGLVTLVAYVWARGVHRRVGTAIGAAIGWFVGAVEGSTDETAADNLKTLGKSVVSVAANVRKL